MDTLPREVRDMIYSNLLPPSGHIALIADTRGGRLKMYSHDPKKKRHTYLEENRVWTVVRETCGRAYDETNELHNENNKDDVFWDKYTFSFTYHLWKDVKQDLSPSYTHLHGPQDEIQHVELELPIFDNGNDEVISFLSSTFSFLKDCTNLKSVTLCNNPYGCSPTFLDIHRDHENENWIDVLCHKNSDIGPFDRLGTFAEIGRFTAHLSAGVKRKMIFDISPEIYTTGTSGTNWWRGPSGNRMLNRWLTILRRAWGRELWVNDMLVRNDTQYLNRVLLQVGEEVGLFGPFPRPIYHGTVLVKWTMRVGF